MKRRTFLIVLVALAGAGVLGHRVFRGAWGRAARLGRAPRTVDDVLEEIGPVAGTRLRPYFERAGVAWPPARAALLGFKREKRLELWAAAGGAVGVTAATTATAADGAPNSSTPPAQAWTFIRSYTILAASGRSGPKLREGDRQVPEGVYRLTELNPNSSYHLSMRVDYPNDFDRDRAAEDGRTSLDGDIYIHGSAVSIGCLAMGDAAIEELFCLVARTGLKNVAVILAPNDLRGGRPVVDPPADVPWAGQVYDIVRQRMAKFPAPPADG